MVQLGGAAKPTPPVRALEKSAAHSKILKVEAVSSVAYHEFFFRQRFVKLTGILFSSRAAQKPKMRRLEARSRVADWHP